jgi:hypothetical protein
MSMKKLGIMKLVLAVNIKMVMFVASILVTLSSAFSTISSSSPILDGVGVSRYSLSTDECSSSRHHYCRVARDQADARGKWECSSSRRSHPDSIVPVVVLLPLLLSFIIAVSPVHATSSSDSSSAAKIYNNVYADPLHSLCERKIQMAKDGTTFRYSGTSVGLIDDDKNSALRGCSQAEIKQYTLRHDALDGLMLDGGRRISLATGGHGNIKEGVWEA